MREAWTKTQENKSQCGVDGQGYLTYKIVFKSRRIHSGEVFTGSSEQQGDSYQRGLAFSWDWLLQVASLAKSLAVLWCESQQWEKSQWEETHEEGSKQADYKVMINEGIGLLQWRRGRCDCFFHPLTFMPVD